MKLILIQDWQRVLIRARLFLTEVHEFSIVSVPVPVPAPILLSSSSSSNSDYENVNGNQKKKKKKQIHCIRMRLLPLLVACALKPPPEFVP